RGIDRGGSGGVPSRRGARFDPKGGGTRMRLEALWFLAGWLVVGCASGPHPAPEVPERPEVAEAKAARPVLAAQPYGPRPVARRDLVRVLDRGPQDLLASIDEDPVVEGGRFRGWVFRGWRDDRYASSGLQAGDVIQRVNGKPIERPEQL